ncbi:hypothetical protein ATANTOWER_000455 [Ataeniobius toweri]|uniref:Uncharacterized protein n=1 Tax=Ataeniobius toweri TaxID=208326 RepID=A0ABU7BMQ4_9TELE|nr:hypothetical protein [Ataeniobius toweri]
MVLVIICLDRFLLFLVMKFISCPVLLSLFSPMCSGFLGVFTVCSSSSSSMSSFVPICFNCSLCFPASLSHLFPVPLITCPIVSCPPLSVFKFAFVPRGVIMSLSCPCDMSS